MVERAAARHLITVGTSKCLDETLDLPGVKTDIERLVLTLTSPQFGYAHTLQELSKDPSSTDVLRKLSAFFCSPDRTSDEIVVVYCAGHGCLLGQWFYLACADTSEDLVGTAFPIDAVVRMVAASRVRFVLLILDTCFAGLGATAFMGGLDEIDRARSLSQDAHVHVLAAARSREVAKDGLFTPLLCDTILRADSNDAGQFLNLGNIAEQVNRGFKAKGSSQRAKQFGAGSTPFFTNPAWKARLTRRQSDLASFWEPRARGGGPTGARAWLFTGREKENRKILKWLELEDANGLRVVTGPPGSGKSAILSRLVLLSDPERRSAVPANDLPEGTVPPPGCVTLAVLAHRKTAPEIAREIADRLCPGLAEPEDIDKLLEGLSQMPSRAVIVLDGLDEAHEPPVIARTLLSRLAALPKLLTIVAARAELLVGLGGMSGKIDLSATKASRQDIASYVERLLTKSSDGSRVNGDPQPLRRAAARVARNADGNYLIAQLAAAALIEGGLLEGGLADERRWDDFPDNVDAAFDAYLEALQSERTFVEDMLRPLAFAEGEGLPETLWPLLASEVARLVHGTSARSYGPSDVVRLLRRAESFVQTRNGQKGKCKFRLFHGAMENHFRKLLSSNVQSIFVDALREPSPSVIDYATSFLPLHAQAAGRIDELALSDSRFLIEADPGKLVDALTAARTPGGQTIARVYEQACHLLVGESPGVRAAYLELFALLNGELELADRFKALDHDRPFRPAWAHWTAAHANRILARHAAKVEAASACMIDDALVYASAGADGVVQIGGQGRDTVHLPGHREAVNAACLCTAEQLREATFVTAGQDGMLRRWGMHSMAEIGPPIQAGTALLAVVDAMLSGQPAVLAADAGKRVRGWNLEDGNPVTGVGLRTDDLVQSMAILPTDFGQLLLCGSQSGTLEIFRLANMEPNGQKVQAHDTAVTGIAILQEAPEVRFVTSGNDGKLVLWRLTGSDISNVVYHEQEQAWFALSSDMRPEVRSSIRPFAAAGVNGLVHLYRWPDLTQLAEPRRGHRDWIRSVSLLRTPLESKVLSAGGDGTVRLWNVPDVPDSASLTSRQIAAVHAVTVCEFPGRRLVVAGGPTGDLSTFDLQTGKRLGSLSGLGRVHAVATLAVRDANYVVVAKDGPVCLHRVRDTGRIGDAEPLKAGDFVGPAYAVAARTGPGTAIQVAAAGMDGRIFWWTSKTSPPQPVTERPGDPVSMVAYSPWGTHLAAGHRSGWLSLIGLHGEETNAKLGEPIHSLAFLELQGAHSLAVGCGDGLIRLFDPATLRPLGRLDVPGSRRVLALGGHRGSLAGQDVIVAGCEDGCLSMVEWPSGFRRLSIETGATMTGLATYAQRAVVASLNGLVAVDLV